jgi:hypothetical protein
VYEEDAYNNVYHDWLSNGCGLMVRRSNIFSCLVLTPSRRKILTESFKEETIFIESSVSDRCIHQPPAAPISVATAFSFGPTGGVGVAEILAAAMLPVPGAGADREDDGNAGGSVEMGDEDEEHWINVESVHSGLAHQSPDTIPLSVM